MSNRRNVPRYDAPISWGELKVTVTCERHSTLGRVWDISCKGLRLQLRGLHELAEGTCLHARIEDTRTGQHEDIELITCWSKQSHSCTFVGARYPETLDFGRSFLSEYLPSN